MMKTALMAALAVLVCTHWDAGAFPTTAATTTSTRGPTTTVAAASGETEAPTPTEGVIVAPLVENVESVPPPQHPMHNMAVDETENVLLTCLLTQSVRHCQWSWHNLDGDEGHVVKEFSPLGDEGRDCSVRFESVMMQQQGVWTCQALPEDGSDLVQVLSIRLVVQPVDERRALEAKWWWSMQQAIDRARAERARARARDRARAGASARLNEQGPKRPLSATVRFEDAPARLEVRAHEPVELACRTSAPVQECHWQWRPLSGAIPETEPEPAAQDFTPPPPGTDCSLRQVTRPEHEGRWQCAVRMRPSAALVHSRPVDLKVLEGITFVELSGEIKVNEGEPVALRCVVSMRVAACQWLWRPLDEADTAPVAVKNFTPAFDQSRDCSVRFATVLKEQQGLWSCAVRVSRQSPFVEAPPTSVKLLPPVKLRFLEIPKDIRVALGHATVLPCVSTSSVKDCLWTWHPTEDKDGKGITVKQFPAFGNHSRDCSIHFKNVLKEQDGYWGCKIRSGTSDAPLEAESPLAKLMTFVSEPIEFSELSQDIHVPNGSHLLLRCVLSSAVHECQWARIAPNSTSNANKLVRTFPAHGNGSRDCSMHIAEASEEFEGIWTCGARKEGESFMTEAPPTRVALLKPESVMVALWAAPGEKVTLACRLSSPQPRSTCYWQHLPQVVVSENNHTDRHFVQQNNLTGVCTLLMDPTAEDLGQWRCVFTMPTKNGEWELATATLILLTTSYIGDKTMDWIVGVLAGLVLLLTILIITILVCKRKTSASKSKNGLGNAALHSDDEKKNPSRYTEAPSKINFQFGEGSLTTGTIPSQQSSDSPHIYEPVDRYLSPPATKSIYENVK